MNKYNITIRTNNDNNQVIIDIQHERGYSPRQFTIKATKDGLTIKANGNLEVYPVAWNEVEIDHT